MEGKPLREEAQPPAEPEPKPKAGKPLPVCDRCGSEMYAKNCKVVCPNCGSRFDCSDLSVYFD